MTYPLLFSDKHKGPTGPLYDAFVSNLDLAGARDRLEEIWQQFAPHADSHFIDEFRRDLHARFWELFLFALFVQAGHSILPHLSRGPDLKIRLQNGRLLWVEAVTPGPGDGPDAVPPLHGAGFVPSEQIVLRLRSAIRDKILKIRDYVEAGIVDPTDYVILAVNPGKIRFTMMDAEPSFALQCVYPLGAPYVAFDTSTGAAAGEGFSHRPSIQKQSGAPVSTAVFIDPESSPISAMLYSPVLPYYIANVDPPYTRLCRLVHNGVAATPLEGLLGWEGEARAQLLGDRWQLAWTW